MLSGRGKCFPLLCDMEDYADEGALRVYIRGEW
jgi:hypothetical protein